MAHIPTPYLDQVAAALQLERQISETGAQTPALRRLRSLVESLRTGLRQTPDAGPVRDAIGDMVQRLGEICAVYDADSVEERAATTYATPQALRADLALAVTAAPEQARRVLEMQTYVRRADVGDAVEDVNRAELTIDRRVVLERLAPAAAVQAPHQLDELAANFEVFRSRYERAYLDHHAQTVAATALLQRAVQDQEAAARALTLLNAVTELGPPVAPAVPAMLDDQIKNLVPCTFQPEALRALLHVEPRCRACGLRLSDSVAAARVDRWREDLQRALGVQQQRLARAMVSHAVQERDRPAFERFLRALRAGEVAPLVAVLDTDVAALIRELLSAPR